MEHVLCVIDFSAATPGVFGMAVELARGLEKGLTVLYPYRILPDQGSIADYRTRVIHRAQQSFSELEKLHLNGSLKYDFRAEVGFLSDRVESYYRQTPVYMVVIGHKMAFDKTEENITNLQELLRRVPVPVVVVPESPGLAGKP